MHNEKTRKKTPLIKKENTCKEEQVDYLKLFGLLELNEMIDGLHPNPAGYEKISRLCSKTYHRKW